MRNAFPVVLCVWTPASVQHCMFDCCYRLCYASFCMIVVLLFAWVSRFSAPIFSVFTQTSADSISSGHCCLQVCFVTAMTNESKIIEIIICACGLQILYYFVNIYTFQLLKNIPAYIMYFYLFTSTHTHMINDYGKILNDQMNMLQTTIFQFSFIFCDKYTSFTLFVWTNVNVNQNLPESRMGLSSLKLYLLQIEAYLFCVTVTYLSCSFPSVSSMV